MVSQSAANAVKHRPAEPFGWCRKWARGAVLVSSTNVLTGVERFGWCFEWCRAGKEELWRENISVCGWTVAY